MSIKNVIQDGELNNQFEKVYGPNMIVLSLLNPKVHIGILHNDYGMMAKPSLSIVCKVDLERMDLAKDIVEAIGGTYRFYSHLYIPTSPKYIYFLRTGTVDAPRFTMLTIEEVNKLQKLLITWNKAPEESKAGEEALDKYNKNKKLRKEIKTEISNILLSLLDLKGERLANAVLEIKIKKKPEVVESSKPLKRKRKTVRRAK